MAKVKKPIKKVPKAQLGRLINKVVKKSAGMTDEAVDYGKVALTDAQKAKNAEILNRPKTTYIDKLRKERMEKAEKATLRNQKAFQAKLDALKKKAAPKAKDGMWMQKAAASIKKRGTAGKCTPITKPGCTGKAKALAKTFKKIAKSNKKK